MRNIISLFNEEEETTVVFSSSFLIDRSVFSNCFYRYLQI